MWFFKALAYIVIGLPFSWRWGLARGLTFLWWDVFRFRRFTLYRNVTIVFPQDSHDERIRLIRQGLTHLGYTTLEVLTIPAISESWVDRNVVFEGGENYERARALNKGILFLSLHLANGDLGATALSLKGHPFHLISKRFRVGFLNRIWWKMREEKGTHFIDAHASENAFAILKALRSKQEVCFVLDQFMGRPFGLETTFFGRPTGTAYGLALFAAKTHAPVVPTYTYRGTDLKTHVVFAPPVEFEEVADKDLQMKRMTQKYNGVLEDIIRTHPEQWMWVHRRWKKWE
ncbi:MAG: lipid A biosynthesis lauroyl acyltransferase [Bdellovibrio sp.]|nr:MAG: lipid A biosynthesis lauroyl acyltransferase [Bdellovibrio sp.]